MVIYSLAPAALPPLCSRPYFLYARAMAASHPSDDLISLAEALPRDGRQSQAALAIQRGLGRLLQRLGMAHLPEISLPNQRRADVMALGGDGGLWIIEVKSSVEDFRADQKWPEYADYCDRFFFAVGPDFPTDILPETCGLIVADAYDGEIIRPAETAKLAAARRHLLTRRLARIGAMRLARIEAKAESLNAKIVR